MVHRPQLTRYAKRWRGGPLVRPATLYQYRCIREHKPCNGGLQGATPPSTFAVS